MHIVDHAPQFWFLLSDQADLFLDVNCSHSFVGYTFGIRLNHEERSQYQSGGRNFLSQLAENINDSAPVIQGSQSLYKTRKNSPDIDQAISAAISGNGNKVVQRLPCQTGTNKKSTRQSTRSATIIRKTNFPHYPNQPGPLIHAQRNHFQHLARSA